MSHMSSESTPNPPDCYRIRAVPPDTRAARALCGDDVRAERAPPVRGVHEGAWSTLGVHSAHFRPMCLTARNRQPAPPYERYLHNPLAHMAIDPMCTPAAPAFGIL